MKQSASPRRPNAALLRSALWLGVLLVAWKIAAVAKVIGADPKLPAMVVLPVLIACVLYGALGIEHVKRASPWQALGRNARGHVVWMLVGAVIFGAVGTCAAMTLPTPNPAVYSALVGALFVAAAEATLALNHKRCLVNERAG